MKSIGRGEAGLLDASAAHRSSCRTRRGCDRQKPAEPSVHLIRIIEIIWQIWPPAAAQNVRILDFLSDFCMLKLGLIF
jgi:hypothetical protein